MEGDQKKEAHLQVVLGRDGLGARALGAIQRVRHPTRAKYSFTSPSYTGEIWFPPHPARPKRRHTRPWRRRKPLTSTRRGGPHFHTSHRKHLKRGKQYKCIVRIGNKLVTGVSEQKEGYGRRSNTWRRCEMIYAGHVVIAKSPSIQSCRIEGSAQS